MTNQPNQLYQLTANITFYSDADKFNSTIVVGLFKKDIDALRVMRILRTNNPEKITFKIECITNPSCISPLLEDKDKIF